NNLSWREDKSNASTKYLRNKLRHDVIPTLKEINPQLLQNFQKTLNHLQDSKIVLNDSIEEIYKKVVSKISEDEIHFSIEKLKSLSQLRPYLYEFLKEYHYTEWLYITDLLDIQTESLTVTITHRYLK